VAETQRHRAAGCVEALTVNYRSSVSWPRMTEWTPELLLARQVRWRRVRMVLAVLIAVGIGVVFVFRYL
jgi:hypothetical protein